MASDFIGGGLPPSAAAHTDPQPAVESESSAPATTSQPPASNPGSDDPTAGIAKEAGGVSSTAQIGSPVTEEHEKKTVVGTVLEAVFGKSERTAEEHTVPASSDNTATVASTTSNEQATGSGVAGAAGAVAGTAAAGATAAANAVGANSSGTTAQEEGQKTAASVEKSTAETEAAASQKVTEATSSSAAKDSTVAAEKEDAHEKAKDEDGDVDHEKAKKIEDHKAAVRENKDAIPTAGGEKLGQAHEGESKVIPEVPPKAADESTPGQPDKTTADNTAKNAGEAPVKADAPAAADAGKPKKRLSILGKVKAKLHLDKKDKS